MRQYLLALSFRYIFKIVDPATRNFLYFPDKHQVVSLDEEAYGNRNQNSFWNNLKKTEVDIVFVFVEKHFPQILKCLKQWKKSFSGNQKEIVGILGNPKVYNDAVERLIYLCDKENFLGAIKNSCRK